MVLVLSSTEYMFVTRAQGTLSYEAFLLFNILSNNPCRAEEMGRELFPLEKQPPHLTEGMDAAHFSFAVTKVISVCIKKFLKKCLFSVYF